MTEWMIFFQLFIGSLLIRGGYASCPIESIPPRVVVKHGDPVSVNCSTSESKFEGIGWEASQGSTGIRTDRHVMWTVESLVNWDISPMCYFNSLMGAQCITKSELVIYEFPDAIDISSSYEFGGTMIENRTYNFTCSILRIAPVHNLTIRWYRGHTVIHTETFTDTKKEPTNRTSILSFTPTRQDNGATIRCDAHMDMGPEGPQFNASSKELDLKVKFGPDIECHSIEVSEGKSLDGKCNVTGNPTPYVVWSKDGHSINLMHPSRRNDTGKYGVKAEGFTMVEKEIQVNVLYGPEWMCPATYTISEYSSHNLRCSQGFPEPVEIWYKDEEEVKLPEILTRMDAGRYCIIVSNSQKTLNFTMDIDVHYPPSNIVELEDSEVEVGKELDMKCSAVANPRSNYSWIYFKTPNVNEITEDGVSRLCINNATGFNTGFYTCQAWNVRGSVYKTVRVTVKGAKQECPIKIEPETSVLQYNSTERKSAVCQPNTDGSNQISIYWEIHGDISDSSWSPNTQRDWDPKPVCHGNVTGIGNCSKTLNYILYKLPDNVSIDSKDKATSREGDEIESRCSFMNVAPAKSFRIRWSLQRGNKTLASEGMKSKCNVSEARSPVVVDCTLGITSNRTHDGIQVRCEAESDSGPEGPQPPPITTSNTFNISVLYKPKINTTKLSEVVPVIRGYKEELVCDADGNPPPTIKWNYTSATASVRSNGTLIVNEEGIYNCTAENSLDSDVRVVRVILKEDYSPLIAGFVALTVVAISIIFVSIYSIYYKNTKMRRYNLKNPKLSGHNGNVAHNGWDIQLPVTKLS